MTLENAANLDVCRLQGARSNRGHETNQPRTRICDEQWALTELPAGEITGGRDGGLAENECCQRC